ncbi:MAG: hypothetical protein IKK93_04790 [Campylobacter sp.]|nr:hypothetical protein [Campylobacter sp.]
MFKNFLLGLGLAAMLSGCATIFGQGGYDHFDITSDPNEAKIIITDLTTNKVVIDTKTPLEIDLKKYNGYFSGKSYKVLVSKEGYKDIEFTIDSRANGIYLAGNLVFGGLIGWLVVDPLTGAMWTLDISKNPNIENKSNNVSIKLISDLTDDQKQNLKPIAQ